MLKSNQNFRNNLKNLMHVCIPVLEDIVEAEADVEKQSKLQKQFKKFDACMHTCIGRHS